MLGGSIVGRHAAELISVIALAVTANLKVTDIVESLLVHPALSEALPKPPSALGRSRRVLTGHSMTNGSMHGDDVAAADRVAG